MDDADSAQGACRTWGASKALAVTHAVFVFGILQRAFLGLWLLYVVGAMLSAQLDGTWMDSHARLAILRVYTEIDVPEVALAHNLMSR